MQRRYTISVDEKVGDWIEEQIAAKRFRNASHGFEFCAAEAMKRKKQ